MTAVARLIAMRMSVTMVPLGTTDPFTAALAAMSTSASIGTHARNAAEWAKQAFAALRAAGMVGSDEELAAVVLDAADKRKAGRLTVPRETVR